VAQKARVAYQGVVEALSQDPATPQALLAELEAEIAELEQGKPDKVARIAAARKLLLIAHAICKSGESYRDLDAKEG